MPRLFLALLFIATLGTGTAQSQSIDIVLHPDNPSCQAAEVGNTPWIELHVVANLSGSFESFQGAQFKVEGMPSSWNEENVSWVWDASVTLALGNPLFASDNAWDSVPGGIAAWASCRAGLQGMQRIGKILLLGAPTAENITLEVMPYQLHPDEDYCPMMNHCDAPQYPSGCVTGGSFTLNGGGGGAATCTILAVEETTWSIVKGLYQ